jgi:uncharacterized low-complexity protein
MRKSSIRTALASAFILALAAPGSAQDDLAEQANDVQAQAGALATAAAEREGRDDRDRASADAANAAGIADGDDDDGDGGKWGLLGLLGLRKNGDHRARADPPRDDRP